MVDSLTPREEHEHATEPVSPRPEQKILSSGIGKTPATASMAPAPATADGKDVAIEDVLRGPAARIIGWILVHAARPLLFVARRFRVVPIPFLGFDLVPRFDDVQEILARDDAFRTPFGAKAALLGWQPSFLLAQQDGPEYRAVKRDVYKLFRATDAATGAGDLADVKRWSYDAARKILVSQGKGRVCSIEVIRELISRVPTRVVEKYYGITTLGNATNAQLRQFEDYLLIVSSYMFADADEPASATTEHAKHAVHAAKQIRKEIRAALLIAKQQLGSTRDDVLIRMLRDNTQEPDPNNPGQTKRRFDDDRIVSYLFAMSLGFVPTNLMANGNMLEILLSRRDALEAAQAAARSGDDDKLQRVLFEAMRFRPLNPGPWRRANVQFLLGADGKRPKLIRKGRAVLASTQSAMFDSNRVYKPRRFDPDRSPYVYMLYGFGLHRCIGKPIADMQITQTMKALLELDGLRPVTKLKRVSTFPHRLTVSYERPAGSP